MGISWDLPNIAWNKSEIKNGLRVTWVKHERYNFGWLQTMGIRLFSSHLGTR